ncbi:uncharacterized protein EAF01_010124 [Botrytis porri]|uniref:uncharacterized protein n=1 Tax=Botrytis porri TaxID=87229 RepID=UPI00190230CE|nr:uncharacterized protein EAF01_010124 [Botrytis porri]KAF7894674.1 hypothetical protein EAF01_010124 [Botrytis porri]
MNPIPSNEQASQTSTQKKTTTTNTEINTNEMIANTIKRFTTGVPIVYKDFEPTPGLETFEKISKVMFPNEGPCKNVSAGCRFKASNAGKICLNCLALGKK